MHVAVVGAGAFGGWTALKLLERGARVTLVDAWGAGNARSSSGGDTRVFRRAYRYRHHVEMAIESLAMWRSYGERWARELFVPSGVLWMTRDEDAYERAAAEHFRDLGVRHEVLPAEEIARRWPQIDVAGIRWATYEPDAGYLLAQRACEAVAEAVVRAGGDYTTGWAKPGAVRGGALEGIQLDGGATLRADRYVFACGPWLGRLFPDAIGPIVRATRQEVFYFGVPPGGGAYTAAHLPVWADHGPPFWYGIPDVARGGFKIGDDTNGPTFEPTEGDRTPSRAGYEAARAYLERRFPGLRGTPLLGARVCQYEVTPDLEFLIDRHPAAANAWFVGGGSGHGYKHAPAVGEHAARRVLEEAPPDPVFGLSRFAGGAGSAGIGVPGARN